MNNVFKLVTLFFLGAIFVAVMLNAKNFALAAGSVFTGVNNMGKTLEGKA